MTLQKNVVFLEPEKSGKLSRPSKLTQTGTSTVGRPSGCWIVDLYYPERKRAVLHFEYPGFVRVEHIG